MKKLLLFACFLAFVSCSQVYRYQSIQKIELPEKPESFYLDKFNIKNTETLLLDRDVISNSIATSIKMVMMNNGFTYTPNSGMRLSIDILIENNDIIKNEQYLSILFKFGLADDTFGTFIISSKSKDFLLNKSMFIDEFTSILSLLKSEVLH